MDLQARFETALHSLQGVEVAMAGIISGNEVVLAFERWMWVIPGMLI